MLNTLFSGIFSSTTETIAVPQFLLGIAVALVIGIFLAAVYSYKTKYTKSFVVTLALLPHRNGRIQFLKADGPGQTDRNL